MLLNVEHYERAVAWHSGILVDILSRSLDRILLMACISPNSSARLACDQKSYG